MGTLKPTEQQKGYGASLINYKLIVGFCSLLWCCFIWACSNTIPFQTLDASTFYKGLKPVAENELSIQYFGIGSVLISYNGKAVFTDPCFSTPSLQEVAFGKVTTDTALINLLNPPLQEVELTLIGHAHYDHLLDLPYLASQFLPAEGKIVGCQTAEHLMTPVSLPQQFVVANQLKGDYHNRGTWIFNRDSTLRVMVFTGHHPPQIARIIKFGMGKIKQPLDEIPEKANKWKEGETYTFLVDFLHSENQEIDKRVFIQTSSGKPPRGMVPVDILTEKAIDVAIVPANVHRTFAAINWLKADHYVIVHWENFFRHKLLKTKPFSQRSINKINAKLTELNLEEQVSIPLPGEFLVF